MTPFGSDRLEAAPDGAFWIICSAPKGWTPRRGRAHTSSEYPGTAVQWETELFEVVEAISHPDGTTRYRLEPWPDRHAVRSIQTYDEGNEAHRPRERARKKRSITKRRLTIILAPLLGHLPGPVQARMESEFGAPAVAMTIASALPLFALGLVSLVFSLAAAFGAGLSGAGGSLEGRGSAIPNLLPVALAVYLVVESGIRMGTAFLQGHPVGSVPGALFYEIARIVGGWPVLTAPAFRGLPARGLRGPQGPPPGSLGHTPGPGRALQDRFRMLEPLLALLTPAEQNDLELRFGMETLRWGKITATLLLVVGGANLVASLALFAAGAGGLGDLVWLVAGAGLSIEQIARLREIARGRPAGSVLGALVRPLAGKLLAPDN
jgi:hypothetical protein